MATRKESLKEKKYVCNVDLIKVMLKDLILENKWVHFVGNSGRESKDQTHYILLSLIPPFYYFIISTYLTFYKQVEPNETIAQELETVYDELDKVDVQHVFSTAYFDTNNAGGDYISPQDKIQEWQQKIDQIMQKNIVTTTTYWHWSGSGLSLCVSCRASSLQVWPKRRSDSYTGDDDKASGGQI